jgi:hypothetical protein
MLRGSARGRRVNSGGRRQNLEIRTAVRANHTKNLVEKEAPFQIRRNRQLVSIPSHRESGLTFERVYRIAVATAANVTSSDLTTAIDQELGVTLSGSHTLTIKELSFYSSAPGPFEVGVFYFTRNGNAVSEASCSFSDQSSSAGVSTISVIYPLALRPKFTVGATAFPLFSITPTPTATNPTFIDVLVYISNAGASVVANVQDSIRDVVITNQPPSWADQVEGEEAGSSC